jgi:hypothetical protein
MKMRKNSNNILYDTATASLIAKTKSMTALSGKISLCLFKSHSGQWFQTVALTKSGNQPTISNWISANSARRWLEKHDCELQLRVYFEDSDTQLQSEQQVLVAECKSPISTNPHELVQVEHLYHHPQKGWFLKQTKESALIPLTADDAARLAKTLQFGQGPVQSSLPVKEQFLGKTAI